ADDTHGPTIDPDRLERTPDPAALERARRLIATRFPAMADAPVVESRVCQYASTPDGQYLIDRHPGAGNVWLLGGGSGHGYKLGPALGEQVATWVLDDATPLPRFALDRAGMLTGGGESQLETGGQG
ncbi:MAG: FAD-dependent oxidoreductase, partial [Acidobacteriota bacterium]